MMILFQQQLIPAIQVNHSYGNLEIQKERLL